MNRPVLNPSFYNAAAIFIVTLPFPLVPVTGTALNDF